MSSAVHRRKMGGPSLSKEDIHDTLDQFGTDTSGQIDMENEQTKFRVDKSTTLQQEWNENFAYVGFAGKLKRKALEGNMGTSRFRSICWMVFWECLSENQQNWVNEVKLNRQNYTNIRKKYVIDPYEQEKESDLDVHHPLSQSEDSVWHKYFQDNELRSTIMIDLERLSPEIDFFKQDSIRSILLHILFCYARENPQVSYKQGMHEILSPIIYVMMTNNKTITNTSEHLSDDIKCVMDEQFIEHDSYWLFANLMESIEPWYANLRPMAKQTQLPNDQRIMFKDGIENQQITAIAKKLNRLQGFMLLRFDSALAEHLRMIQVTPQLYGIRWIRLLFGREFPLHRVLTLWDALFADGAGLDLVDYVYLAMLINLRAVLLENNFNNCLSYLMKYPPNTDTKYILKRALALKYHKPNNTASRPLNNPLQQVPQRKVHPVRNRLGETKEQMYANSLGSGTVQSPALQRKPKKSSPETASIPDNKQFVESRVVSPERTNSNVITNLKTKVNSMQNPLKGIGNMASHRGHLRSADNVNTIVEDHSRLQEQICIMQTELDRLQSLCSYCGLKMDSYLNLLQQRLLKEETFNDEVAILSLTGLKQVRDLFKDSVTSGEVVDHEVDFKDIDHHIEKATKSFREEEASTNNTFDASNHVETTGALAGEIASQQNTAKSAGVNGLTSENIRSEIIQHLESNDNKQEFSSVKKASPLPEIFADSVQSDTRDDTDNILDPLSSHFLS